MSTKLEQDFMLVAEAAEFLRIAPSTLYGWIHQRKVPFRKHGSRVVLARRDLELWSQSCESIQLKSGGFNSALNCDTDESSPKAVRSLKIKQKKLEQTTPFKEGSLGNFKAKK